MRERLYIFLQRTILRFPVSEAKKNIYILASIILTKQA